MLVRERLAIGVAVLATVALWVIPGCSTNSPRDINDKTDVAWDFIPPDASPLKDGTTAVEESGNSVDGGGEDATVSEDTEMAETLTEVSLDGLQNGTVSDPDAAITGAN